MYQKIHTFSIVLVILCAGFFPYMPLAHADFSAHVDHHSHCGSMAHTDGTDNEHSMGECLNLIHEIHFSALKFLEVFHVSLFVAVSLFIVPGFFTWIHRKIIPRNLSPPRHFSEKYIGIVKLTT